jgi:hypothetical protein
VVRIHDVIDHLGGIKKNRLMRRIPLCVSTMVLGFAARAWAYPTIGVTVANAAIETIATSSPLPNLDGNGFVLTPQYGILKTELLDKPGVTDIYTPKPSYSGAVNGTSIGLAVTLPSRGDFGFFLYGATAQQSGDFKIDYDIAPTVNYTDFNASGTFYFAAVQYRAIGDDKSRFALGVFAGPGYYAFRSRVTYNQVNATLPASTVTFNPSGIGPLLGLQLMVRLGNFRINPYMMGFTGATDKCQPIDIPAGGQLEKDLFTCEGKTASAEAPTGFGGLGLIVGYKNLRFRALSFLPAQDVRPMQVTAYSLSYGFEF